MKLLQSILKLYDYDDFHINQREDFIVHRYIKDTSGKFVDACENQISAAGLSKLSELVGLSDYDLLKSKEADSVAANDKFVTYHQRQLIIPETFTNAKGKKSIATSFKTFLLSKTKKIIGIIGISIIHNIKTLRSNLEINPSLSPAQLECLYFLVMGCTMKQISKHMNISHRTVEHYIETIKNKLDCQVRSELVAKGLMIPAIRERL
jgi:DNA-binding CsgD family transcriptional regulator